MYYAERLGPSPNRKPYFDALFSLLIIVGVLTAQLFILPLASSITTRIVGAAAILIAIAAVFAFAILADNSTFARWWNRRIVRSSYWSFSALLSISPTMLFFLEARGEFIGYPVSNKLNLEEQIAVSSAAGTPLFALISDTHITDKVQTLEHQTGGSEKLCQTLKLVRSVDPPVLIVAGDLTDQGEEAEWFQFDALLRDQEKNKDGNRSEIRTLLAPGNHDFQGSPFVLAGQLASAAEHDRYAFVVPYLAREARFLKLAQNVQGDLLTPGGGILRNSTSVTSLEGVAQDALKRRVITIVMPPGGWLPTDAAENDGHHRLPRRFREQADR